MTGTDFCGNLTMMSEKKSQGGIIMIEPRWLKIAAAAEYIGVHPKTLYRACLEGKVPSVKAPGIGRRIDKLALDQFLQARSVGPGEFGKELRRTK